jgi:hypothetical protein
VTRVRITRRWKAGTRRAEPYLISSADFMSTVSPLSTAAALAYGRRSGVETLELSLGFDPALSDYDRWFASVGL